MKKVLLFFVFVSISVIAKTQGNLQFNQVKLVSTLETVPAGKVWKVESAHYNGGAIYGLSKSSIHPLSSLTTFGLMAYLINGSTIHIFGGAFGSSSTNFVSPFPFWLSAGTTLEVSNNMQYLSVIEFNIIP